MMNMPTVFSGLNDDAGAFRYNNGTDRLSIREMWFETKLFGQQVSLVAGKIDLTNYFDSNAVANDETTMFITSAFVNNLALEVPHNGPGAVSYYEMENGLNFRLGLQSADSDNMGLGIGKGFYGIGEVGLHSNNLFGREGNYRLWFKINGDRDGKKGIGISMDQQLAQKLFAFGYSKADDGIKEYATEIYYRFVLNRHVAITPLFQAVFNPAGLMDTDVVTLFGIRTQIEF